MAQWRTWESVPGLEGLQLERHPEEASSDRPGDGLDMGTVGVVKDENPWKRTPRFLLGIRKKRLLWSEVIMIVLTKKIPTISRQLGTQPRSWLGHEADSRAILLIVATATTSSSQPSGPSKPLGFTNNSGVEGYLIQRRQISYQSSMRRASHVHRRRATSSSVSKLAKWVTSFLLGFWPLGKQQSPWSEIRSAKPSLPPATNKKSITGVPPLVPCLNRRTDRILRNRGTIPPYLALVDLHYTVMSSFVLF